MTNYPSCEDMCQEVSNSREIVLEMFDVWEMLDEIIQHILVPERNFVKQNRARMLSSN